jgi:hypothetical protein
MVHSPDGYAERQAIEDAMRALLVIQTEKLNFPDWNKKSKAACGFRASKPTKLKDSMSKKRVLLVDDTLKVKGFFPALGYSSTEHNPFLQLADLIESYDEFGEELGTQDLIKRQQKLGASPLVIDRLTAMAVGATLRDRLNALSDRQIGQLIFDFCWVQMYVDGPELSLVTQAIDRLRRSPEA